MNSIWAIVLIVVMAIPAVGQGAGGAGKDVFQPFWKSPVMEGESILFVRRAGKPITGDLLFAPTKILSVRSSSGAITYKEGRDYQYKPGSNVITVPTGSTIPLATAKQLTPPLGSQPYDLKRRDNKGDILFGETHEYADMQVKVTYEHEPGGWKPAPPTYADPDLSIVLKRLADGDPITIVFYGDSITAGGNASMFTKVAPLQPAYPELVVRNLERAYKSKITFKNFSVGGMTAEWGLKNIDKVAAEKPDLVILAWGMNDSSGAKPRPVKDYIRDLDAQIRAVVAKREDTEFIMVASMLPNGDCYWANPQALLEYRDVMRKVSGHGVMVADMTTVWEEMLNTKNYLDITGNGINHPNDFGHRLYADVLSALLIK